MWVAMFGLRNREWSLQGISSYRWRTFDRNPKAARQVKRILCCIHHVLEEVTDTTYLICGECFHVFPTANDLLVDHNRSFNPSDFCRVTSVEEIYSCPHCIHDF